MASVAVTSVTTEDAAPTSAPHRVSLIVGYKASTVVLALTSSGGSFGALRLTLGVTRTTGPFVATRGCVCGIDRVGAPGVMTMKALTTATFVIDSSKLSVGDGAKTVNVFGLHDTAGWL